MTLSERFTAKTRQTNCTVWIGATNNKGYGLISVDGKAQLAHRVAYEDEFGPIPEGHVIDHLCRVRNCVNPMHLQAVTPAENTRRGRASKTLGIGDQCINGHFLGPEDIYTRSTGSTDCRHCRRANSTARRAGELQPSVRKSAFRVASDLDAVETAELNEAG